MTTPRGSLLVVDDDPQSRHLLHRVLAWDGYNVACAASGAEALETLRKGLPDVVILDWMMPGIDGAEVLRRMAADSVTAAVRVIVYTASNDQSVEHEAIRLGAWACVQKLGGTSDLREHIECCLGSPRPKAGNQHEH
jgi:CheY-like chemotaxis protein